MPTPLITQEIVASDRAKTQFVAEGDDFRVSRSSRFGDAVWRLDSTTPGQPPTQSSIRWDFELPDGRRFTDAKHAWLRHALKRFAWSLFADPRQGPPMAAGSATYISKGLCHLVRWMVRHDYSTLSELNAVASQEYLTRRGDLPCIRLQPSGCTMALGTRHVSMCTKYFLSLAGW